MKEILERYNNEPTVHRVVEVMTLALDCGTLTIPELVECIQLAAVRHVSDEATRRKELLNMYVNIIKGDSNGQA